MTVSETTGTAAGDHEIVSGPLGHDHDTWDAAQPAVLEEAIFKDDKPGHGCGMLESFPGSDRIAGDDDLGEAISGPLLAASPWAWIFRLTAHYEDGSDAIYTGWLASARIIVTSGRCLYDPSRGAAQEVLVEIAQSTGSAGPRALRSKEFRMVNGWVNRANPECDYGAVLLPGEGLANIGHFGCVWLPGAKPNDEWLNLAGYSIEESSTAQWYEGFQVTDTDDYFLRRTGGFHAAAPGSPLWLYMNRGGRAQRYVCGMVSSNADRGEALRLHRDIYNNLVDWIEKASNAGPEPSGATNNAESSGVQPAPSGNG